MRWRLIRSEPASGAWNMAVDEAMLLAHAAGLTLPTLRLYAWSPPALSLGLLQPFNAEWARGCARLGFDLVRRPSGAVPFCINTKSLTPSLPMGEVARKALPFWRLTDGWRADCGRRCTFWGLSPMPLSNPTILSLRRPFAMPA